MIPKQVTTPKWVRPTPDPTRRSPALTMDNKSHNSGYEKKKTATSYVSISKPKKQGWTVFDQLRSRVLDIFRTFNCNNYNTV